MHGLTADQGHYNPAETTLTPASITAAGGLKQKWKATLTGASIGTPLYLNAMTLPDKTVADVRRAGGVRGQPTNRARRPLP